MICISDSKSNLKVLNSAFSRFLGYTKKELLHSSFTNFVHIDDVYLTNLEILKLNSGIATIHFENRCLKKNGTILYIHWWAKKDPKTNLIHYIGRNITEFKKSQSKLKNSENLLNDAQKIAKIGSWEFNLETQKLNWSNELYAIFEIENKPNPNLYQEYIARFPPEDFEILQTKINLLINTKESYEIEHKILLPNNRFKWVFGTGIPIVNDEGKVIIIKGIAQDITEKKLINDIIKKYYDNNLRKNQPLI